MAKAYSTTACEPAIFPRATGRSTRSRNPCGAGRAASCPIPFHIAQPPGQRRRRCASTGSRCSARSTGPVIQRVLAKADSGTSGPARDRPRQRQHFAHFRRDTIDGARPLRRRGRRRRDPRLRRRDARHRRRPPPRPATCPTTSSTGSSSARPTTASSASVSWSPLPRPRHRRRRRPRHRPKPCARRRTGCSPARCCPTSAADHATSPVGEANPDPFRDRYVRTMLTRLTTAMIALAVALTGALAAPAVAATDTSAKHSRLPLRVPPAATPRSRPCRHPRDVHADGSHHPGQPARDLVHRPARAGRRPYADRHLRWPVGDRRQ